MRETVLPGWLIWQDAVMCRFRVTDGLAFLTLGAALICAAPCRAALGGDAASIAADRDALHGVLQVHATAQYEIEEITSDSGMSIREYLDHAGVIFAVAWNGPAFPDLSRLLGKYYADYTSALTKLQPLGLHRSVRVSTESLNVELGGHMRAYAGRAYLTAMVPVGVSRAELR